MEKVDLVIFKGNSILVRGYGTSEYSNSVWSCDANRNSEYTLTRLTTYIKAKLYISDGQTNI